MDIMVYVLMVVAAAVLVLWYVLGDNNEEVSLQLPSSAELKKLKKAELVELAASKDIFVDIKSTKAVIIKEIDSNR